MNDLTVIIVNWNSGSQLGECVKSIRRSNDGDRVHVIVVDNGSHDGSANSIRGIDAVTVIDVLENLGFSKACNLGASLASTRFLLFLNPDTVVSENTLATAVHFLDRAENSNVGICGVQLLDDKGEISRSCARFPTPLRLVAQSFGIDRIFKNYSHVMAEWKHDVTAMVDQVIGAFFLVRRDLFVLLGGFDTRFFVYFEEVDFSFRARKGGWFSAYVVDAQAFHAGGGCSKQVKARRLFYSIRSKLLYSYKHFRPGAALVVTAATILVEPVSRITFALMRGSISGGWQTITAYSMLLRWMIRPRKDQ